MPAKQNEPVKPEVDQNKVDDAERKAQEAADARQEEQQKAQEDAAKGAEDKGPLGSPGNPLHMVTAPPPADPGVSAMASLNPKQSAGLEPVDNVLNEKEAAQRLNLTNMQTTFERENTLDPVSGGPSVGVTDRTPLTGVQQGQTPTDMSGRPAMPMGMQKGDEDFLPKIREALTKAKDDDSKDDAVPEQQKGWRTPFQMGIPGGVVQRVLAAIKNAPVEAATVPNGDFFPETGTRYRLK